MLFKKNDSANLVSKSTKYWKNRPQKTKEAQNVVFNLKGRIPLLFYCVKHIHRQFKTYLKPEFSFSNKYPDCSMEKPCCDILLNPFCFLSYRFLNLYDTTSFDMSCFHCSVWHSDHCIVFSKLVKWKVLLKLYFEQYSFTYHFTKFLSHFLKNAF
jgi:hypothetical protein